METSIALQFAREALWLMLLASAPPLAATLVVGVVMSVMQAATQVQENTLSVVPKLFAAAGALAIAGPFIGARLIRFSSQLLAALTEINL